MTRTDTPKVTFLGIGVQKCATSWLHGIATDHTDIGTPAEKEQNFFQARFDLGYAWYENQFADGVAVGEFSPNYFTSRDATERAHAYNPDLRLIAILRDPVARAFSNHLHEIRKGHIPADTSFEDALQANPAYVEQGLYGKHLQRWIAQFSAEQCLILLAEDIAAAPETAFQQVCTHLGVRDDVEPEGLNERRHESVASKSAVVQKTLRSGGDALRGMGLGKAVKSMKNTRLIGDLVNLNKVDLRESVPEMQDDTRAYLEGVFAEDIAWVAETLGRDLPWRSPAATRHEETSHVA